MNYRVWAIVTVTLGLLAAPALPGWCQKAPDTQEATVLYQKAVGLLDSAEAELAVDSLEKALALVKEARGVFATLQQQQAGVLEQHHLSPAQAEQEARNKKLADDSFQQGEYYERAADEKMAKAQELTKKGKKQEARKLQSEAQEEYDLSLGRYIQSQLYSLRNQQLAFAYLEKK